MDNGSMLTFVTAILLFSSFVKICTALSIFRVGLGLEGAAFGVVVLVLSAALALPSFDSGGASTTGPNQETFENRFRVRLETVADPLIVQKLQKALSHEGQRPKHAAVLPSTKTPTADPAADQASPTEFPVNDLAKSPVNDQAKKGGDSTKAPFSVVVSAYLLTELRTAFRLGFLFIVPFIVIDLLVANILAALGLTTLSLQLVSLPIKLVLFLAVDGWTLIGTKLLGS